MRKWISALIIALLALPLAACGEKDEAQEHGDQKRVLPYLA